MKSNRIHALAAAALMTAAGASQLFAQAKDYRDIKAPALHEFKIQEPKRIALDNGMVIFLQEDHELPLIRGSARIRGGARDVDAAKTGLAGIYGASWRNGGTETKTGDQLDDLLESRAARVETGAGDDSTTIRLDTLKGDFATVFPIFVELLRKPAFRQEKIDLAKTQANTAISRRNDDPGSILGRETSKLAYGATSPYARQTEYATINAITRDDLVKFHDRFVQPNNIIVGVVGDFDSKSMEAMLRQAFASWPKGPAAPPAPTEISPAKPGVYFVAKDDVTQSNISIVHLGPMRNNPDFYAIEVMNEVLDGGSFSGRFMNNIRTAKGLAYSVGGGVRSGWDHPGQFRVSMGTKSASTVEAINGLRQEISDIQTKPVSAEEIASAKERIANSFIFTMDTKGKVLNERMALEFYGFPADWYSRYLSGVQKVTADDVTRVANKYVTPDKAALLVVGKEADFDKPLSTLGQVTKLDVTIPEGTTPGAAKKSAAATNPGGLALIKKVQDFVGGQAKVASVKATRSHANVNRKTPQGEMAMEIDALVEYPDRTRTTMKMPQGEMTMVSTPESAFVITPMGMQDLPSSQREDMKKEMSTDLLTVLSNTANPSYTFTAAGNEKIGDVDAQIVEISVAGNSVKWWIDPATGRLLRKSQQARGPQPGESIVDYTAWQNFGGINMPVKTTMSRNGEQVGSMEVSSVEINPTIDKTLYDKPAK
ncbi:MAG: peptidase M16-like protein [Acidobacteria bacterium]|nr:peptidase M16-like protein [Acidobacteriota bacterium]